MKTCPKCQAQNADDATFCMSCGFDLVRNTGEAQAAQGKSCSQCGASLSPEALFCAQCGTKVETGANGNEGGEGKTMFFGAMQESGQAKLILVRGGGFEGVSYALKATDHIAGRDEGFILFPEDKYCSPKHANFYYFGGKFFVNDEESLNGVFVKLRNPLLLQNGSVFRLGEQIFEVAVPPSTEPVNIARIDDGSELYASPVSAGGEIEIRHLLNGGKIGATFHPSDTDAMTFGRSGCTLNFPTDGFISGRHAEISKTEQGWQLKDMGSKNGVFIKIEEERELMHGDFVFIGQQLLRVEIT